MVTILGCGGELYTWRPARGLPAGGLGLICGCIVVADKGVQAVRRVPLDCRYIADKIVRAPS